MMDMAVFPRCGWISVLALLCWGCGCSSAEVPAGVVGVDGSDMIGGGSSTGGASAVGGTSGSGGGTSGSGGGTSGSGSGISGSGGGMGASGGGSVSTLQCPMVDGVPAYGPIGEPQLSADGVVPDDGCAGDCTNWTGEGYLTAFPDERGVVVALLDEAGAVLGENVVSAETVDRFNTNFSSNGESVLVVMRSPSFSAPALYVLVDPKGVPLGAAQPLTVEEPGPTFGAALIATDSGWLVALGYSDPQGSRGVLLADVAVDGSLRHQAFVPVGGYVYQLGGFVPSAYGGHLLVGQFDSGGQYGGNYNLLFLIDDALQIAYSEAEQDDQAGEYTMAFLGIVDDAGRDLVYGTQPGWSEGDPYVVQEYGCLD
jgi:hypothetical protein